MNFCFRSKFALKAFFLFKRKSFIEIHNNGPNSALITYFDRVSYFFYKIKCMKKINAFFWKSKIKYAYYSKNNFVFYITYTTFMIYIIISKETSFCVCVFNYAYPWNICIPKMMHASLREYSEGFYWRNRLYMQSGKSRRSIIQYLTRYYSFTTREIATLISNRQCKAIQTLHWIKEMKGNCRLLWEQINLLLSQGNIRTHTSCCIWSSWEFIWMTVKIIKIRSPFEIF